MEKNSKIYVAGHTGMVGSAILRKLKEEGFNQIIGRTFEELDLTNQQAVIDFFESERPEYVFLAAAKVGGILANNNYHAQLIYENLMIQNNIIHNSFVYGAKKLLFLGSSCIYPNDCHQPIKEEYLLTGELEQTNEPYAIAKIAGIKMCENYHRQYGCNFISVIPPNLYGPNDNYNLQTSHVLTALIRKMHLGKCLEKNDWTEIRKDLNKRPIECVNGLSDKDDILRILSKYGITITSSFTDFRYPSTTRFNKVNIALWGNGKAFSEFMHVDDMGLGCLFTIKEINMESLISNENKTFTAFLNIGTGIDQTIKDLAFLIKPIVGYNDDIVFDQCHPDATYKKLLDVSILQRKGFKPKHTLKSGITQVYQSYQNNLQN